MAVSLYFDQHENIEEQKLFDELAVEAIQVNGVNVYYLPRRYGNLDELFNEDDSSYYDRAYLIDMYVKDYEGFGGRGDFLSTQLEIDDTVTFVVARKSWKDDIGAPENKVRPLEGDLIWFPMNRKIFKIMFVEHESVFYLGGSLYVWELRCELFKYSGEIFDTGIPEVDEIDDSFGLGLETEGLLLEDGLGTVLEDQSGLPVALEDYTNDDDEDFNAQNDLFQTEANSIIDWSCVDPFVRYPSGRF